MDYLPEILGAGLRLLGPQLRHLATCMGHRLEICGVEFRLLPIL